MTTEPLNQYDAAGNLIKEFYDADGDGIFNSILTYAYDTANRRISKSYDDDGDGTPNDIEAYAYDSANNLIRQTNDYNADGTLDYIATYTYDAAGNKASESVDYGSVDSGADGIPDTVVTYDAAGQITSQTYDYDSDGTPNSINTYTYDAAGNRTSETYDYDGDGNPNSINTYTYDAAGNLIRSSSDNNGDGNPEAIITTVYDAAGNIISRVSASDYNSNGNFNTIFTYNSLNQLSEEAVDKNDDGNLDEISTYNSARQLTRKALDKNSDGTLDKISIYTYDAAGILVSKSNDADGDGNANSSETYSYTYNEAGKLVSRYGSIDENGDGSVDKVSTYTNTYDAAGTLIQEFYDAGNPIASLGYGLTSPVVNESVQPLRQSGSTEFNNTSNKFTSQYRYNLAGKIISGYTTYPGGTIQATYTYDGNGNLIKKEDPNNPITYDYDEDNNLIKETNRSGTITYTYDENGNQTTISRDFYSNSINRVIEKNTYDEAGNKTSSSIDSSGTGTQFLTSFTATYNSDGNEISSARNFGSNGSFDYFTTSIYTFDDAGNLTRSIFVDSLRDGVLGKGTFDQIFNYTFNTSGKQIRETRDQGADGSLDYVLVSNYDEQGNLIAELEDSNGDGSFETIKQQTNTYDAAGNQIGDRTESASYLGTVSTSVFGIKAVGTSGDDSLSGTENNDILTGEAGEDTLSGLNGDDILFGGEGNDLLTGGQGQDTFVLAAATGTDTFSDFSADDLIGLAGGIGFGDLTFLGNDILLSSSNEVLAKLTGVDTTTLQAAQFVAA